MKKNSVIITLFILILPVISFSANPNFNIDKLKKDKIETPVYEGITTWDILNFDKKEIEKKLDRKLSLKETLSLRFVKRKLQKNNKLSPEEAFSEVKFDGLAIAGFISSIVGLFIFGIILGLVGIILSAIALNRINSSEGTTKGRGLAIAGLIIGVVDVAVILLLLSMI